MNQDNDNISHIRSYLQGKSTEYLVDLLIDLVQAAEEPLRRRFWDRLAPPAVATADLRYASPEAYLAELKEFVEAVENGEYYDEAALEYYGEDSFDREYRRDKYGWYEDYDPDAHEGLNALRSFLDEADSYFRAGQYDIAAEAYSLLISVLIYGQPEETLGIYSPLAELNERDDELAQRYFVALQQSASTADFYEEALTLLARYDAPYFKHLDNFLALIGAEGRADLQTHLEQWDDKVDQSPANVYPIGIPFQLNLLIRFYTETNQRDRVQALQQRFRQRYLAFYEPLLAEREAAGDWSTVITYGQEVLALLPPAMSNPYHSMSSVNSDVVRRQMAQAYKELGDPQNAADIYQPVFERRKNFDHYITLRRLLDAVDLGRGQTFTANVIAELREKLPGSVYFLCQVYLSENQFSAAYALVEQQRQYSELDVIKLVAKAHLIAGLGATATLDMGKNLHALYAAVGEAGKEPTQFLRDYLPQTPAIDRKTTIAHAEHLYRNLIQMHIDNGRKTYGTAAYYCALLAEIAKHEGREGEFKQFYQDLLNRYPRHRALRQELAAVVKI